MLFSVRGATTATIMWSILHIGT